MSSSSLPNYSTPSTNSRAKLIPTASYTSTTSSSLNPDRLSSSASSSPATSVYTLHHMDAQPPATLPAASASTSTAVTSTQSSRAPSPLPHGKSTSAPATERTRLFPFISISPFRSNATSESKARENGAGYGSITTAYSYSSNDEEARSNDEEEAMGFFARRPLLRAGLQFLGIFIFSSLFLGGTLWLALPKLDEADRPRLRVPKSFEQLQDLNELLKKYREIYPVRLIYCFVVVYLFLQAFTLPGSMYLSILAGAVWGIGIALPLCCACVASGASLNYCISWALGPALLAMPRWRQRLDTWSEKIDSHRANLLSYLIVIRIAPLPPHWIVNSLCPHVGIGLPIFWASSFIGIIGATIIHTTIGEGLDEMTSAKDFHLVSWKNALVLSGIVVAVLVPVGIRYFWRDELASTIDSELPLSDEERERVAIEGVIIESGGPPVDGSPVVIGGVKGKGKIVTVDSRGDSRDADEVLPLLSDELPKTSTPPKYWAWLARLHSAS